MKSRLYSVLSSASLTALALGATPAFAQGAEQAGASGITEADIIVTARRRDETAQDVPLVVNAVTSDSLAKLNIREFKDVSSLVPGLTLQANANGIGTTSTLRGVSYDVNASGTNGTIEFYQNEAPISADVLYQTMFDVGQIEVLRGPQGTLRGRASPSGSITVTTKRPDLYSIGGYITGTVTDIGGYNTNGAVNLPLIEGKLAIRVAGSFDRNEANRVHSYSATGEPYSNTWAGRASVRFEPFDNLTMGFTYQHLARRSKIFDQNEAAFLTDATLAQPRSGVIVRPEDFLSSNSGPRRIKTIFDSYNWQAEYRLLGQKINYVGSLTDSSYRSFQPNDTGDFFTANFPAALQTYGQDTNTFSKQESHELRLSSEEQLFGMVDYVVGGFINRQQPPTSLNTGTPLFLAGFPISPATYLTTLNTNVNKNGRSIERSLFGNLTVHFGDKVEVSGGVRYINFKNEDLLVITAPNGVSRVPTNQNFNTVIYSASAKYKINDDLMVYAATGSSWRPSASAVGDFSTNLGTGAARVANEQAFIQTQPEKSKSYEVGVKSSWFDKRVTLNATYFHQDFTNFVYRVPGSGVVYITRGPAGETLGNFNFINGVPVKVDGVEIESSVKITPHWNLGVSGSYALGKIANGRVPCTPAGITAASGVAAYEAASGGQTVGACATNQRANFAPLITINAQSEYSARLTEGMDGYLRGLINWYGDSQNDPSNLVDDVKSYTLLNLYLGIRDPNGAWEVGVYGKNLTETQRVLNRSIPLITTYGTTAGGGAGAGGYRTISMTNPREFGVNLRWAFGSR